MKNLQFESGVDERGSRLNTFAFFSREEKIYFHVHFPQISDKGEQQTAVIIIWAKTSNCRTRNRILAARDFPLKFFPLQKNKIQTDYYDGAQVVKLAGTKGFFHYNV